MKTGEMLATTWHRFSDILSARGRIDLTGECEAGGRARRNTARTNTLCALMFSDIA
jgi:hypothetical protein